MKFIESIICVLSFGAVLTLLPWFILETAMEADDDGFIRMHEAA